MTSCQRHAFITNISPNNRGNTIKIDACLHHQSVQKLGTALRGVSNEQLGDGEYAEQQAYE
jgi:hypothetical protein